MADPSRAATNRTMKSTAVAATLTLTLAGALTACGGGGGGKGSGRSGFAEMCVERANNTRVTDFRCAGRADPGLSWYYMAHTCGRSVTPVTGAAAAPGQGSFNRPSKGKVERGGFGSCPSKSSS